MGWKKYCYLFCGLLINNALASTKINGSESRVVESLSPLNKSVERTISVPIEPKRVTFLVNILFARIQSIISPSASLNVSL